MHFFNKYFPRATSQLLQIGFEKSKLPKNPNIGNGKCNRESEEYNLENLLSWIRAPNDPFCYSAALLTL